MTQLAGKCALVTGASRGIGRAIAQALANAGADVAITYQHSADKAQEVVRAIEQTGRRAVAIQADSADPQAVQRSVAQAVEALGGLDILVNNAGIARYESVTDVSLATLDELLNVNVRSVVLATQSALPHLGQGGRIINIGSSLAEQVPFPGVTLYSMTKSALISFTKGLARDVGPRGITVNIVNPGSTDTDMNPADGAGADGQRSLTALGHYGKPEDVAAAVVFLASPAARQITGTRLMVDGGASA